MKTWVVERYKYQQIANSIESAAILSTKDSQFWSVVWWIMYLAITIFTIGLKRKKFLSKMNKKIFLEEYATTFGPFHAYPRQFEALGKRLLVHECRHTTHCVWLGWSIPIIGWFFGRRVRAYCGLPLYSILYLFVFFPIYLSYFRYLFELDCETVSYVWSLKNGYNYDQVKDRAEDMARQVYSWNYGKAWFEQPVKQAFLKAVQHALSVSLLK